MPLRKLLRLSPSVGALLLLTSVRWALPVDQGRLSAIAFILILLGLLILIGLAAAFYVSREGKIVAEARFNPGRLNGGSMKIFLAISGVRAWLFGGALLMASAQFYAPTGMVQMAGTNRAD